MAMKYEEYEALVENVTSENALETLTKVIAKVKEDSIAIEAERLKATEEMEAQTKKYQDLQVDYIHKFIGATGKSDDGGSDEDDTAAKLEEMTKIIHENMNS